MRLGLIYDELAAVLGVGLNQAYAAVQMGQVPAVRFGRRWLIPRKTLDRIANGEVEHREIAAAGCEKRIAHSVSTDRN